jgi:hypothetical protein
MFKDVSSIAERAVGAASQEQRQDAVRVSNRVFKTLQGMYGSLFLSKFSTGKVLPNGGDAGVISARDVWAVSLQRFDAGTVGPVPCLPPARSLQACGKRYRHEPDIAQRVRGEGARNQREAR